MLHYMEKKTKLSARERDQIALLAAEGLNKNRIAEKLGRHRSTIGRELERNSSQRRYWPSEAQQLADSRKIAARKRPRLKNLWLREFVEEKIHQGWTPERISGRLGKEYGGDWDRQASTETIYAWLYSSEAPKGLKELLPRHHKRRGQVRMRGRKKLKILDRVPISERPPEVEARCELGHWEGDSIVSKGRQGGLHTEVERASRFLCAQKIEDLRAETTAQAQRKIFQPLPAASRKTTTLDNGLENAQHQQLRALGMQAYFAEPYSSWQRGSNENANGLIRRSFPKGTDFAEVSQRELQMVVDQINDWPRKCLNWGSAKEVFAKLSEMEDVAITPRI
jgi:IS30 family transposase